MKSLIVVLGAGASHDCLQGSADGYEEHQPPLAKELFDRRFSRILERYPLAQMEAADIIPALATGAVGLEEHLLDLKESKLDIYSQARWREIPLYLQELLFQLSLPIAEHRPHGGFTNRPGNYDGLVNAVLRLDEILFITLNYDTILDSRLAHYPSTLPDSLDWYITPDRNWSLLKLHGSVNWGNRVLNDPIPTPEGGTGTNVVLELGDALELDPKVQHLGKYPTVDALRWSRQPGGEFYYPALSVPLGPEDGLSCPETHQDFLQERLRRIDLLNLLVIGYSGLDKSVLRLLRESGKELGRVKIVNGDTRLGYDSATNLAAGLEQPFDPAPVTFDGGFRDFMAGGELPAFLELL